MDEKLQRQLVRQLKLLNFWITLFGSIMLIGFVVIGFFLYQVISFAQDTSQKIDSARQQLDVQEQVCSRDDRLSQVIRQAGGCE